MLYIKKISRREFLIKLGLAGVGFYLSGCTKKLAAPISAPPATIVNPLFYQSIDTAELDGKRPFNPRSILNFSFLEWEAFNQGIINTPVPIEISRSHVNLFCPDFFGVNTPDEIRDSMHSMSTTRKYGIGSIVWISSMDNEGFDRMPEGIRQRLKQAEMKDLDGNTIFSTTFGNSPKMCQNNPVWRDFKSEEIRVISDSEFFGFGIDEAYGNYGSVPFGGCYCQYCMEGFREHLKEKMSPAELTAFTIEDVDTFDYGAYIKQNYYAKYKMAVEAMYENPELADLTDMPLIGEFLFFQYKSSTDYMKFLRSKVDEQSGRLGRKIPLGANLSLKDFGAVDYIDCITSEMSLSQTPDAALVAAYELGNSIDAPVLSMPNSGQWEVMTGVDAAGLLKIYTAEAYAHRGMMSSPYASPFFKTGKNNSKELYGSIDMDQLYPYYDFIYQNPMLFEHLWSKANVGILYSQGAMNRDHHPHKADSDFWEQAKQLTAANIPLKVIFDGDGNLSQRKIQSVHLESLNLLILPGDVVLDNNSLQILSDFMEKGGKIISFNATTNVKQLDKFLAYSGDPASELVQIVKSLHEESFSINDADVLVTPYFSTDVFGYIFHLVNYSFDAMAHDVSTKYNVKMEIINDLPFELGDLGIYYLSPDNNSPTELEFTEADGKLNFAIQIMSGWAAVVVGQKVRVSALQKLDQVKTAYDTRGMTLLPANVESLLEQAHSHFVDGNYDQMYSICKELLPL